MADKKDAEIELLKKDNELLKKDAETELLKKDNEILKKEIEILKLQMELLNKDKKKII